jgi:alkanesulfonate monooxygenase SsuD/methylene tetrahydromethanopterin reductase-like flavin-dependent oxidoreductase (luciferase family)
MYDNLDPLTALAAAAASTTHIELVTTVLNVCWRNNPVLLAKQLSSVGRLSGGRLTAGLGMGGWPADYAASGVPLAGRGALLDASLDAMRAAWTELAPAPRIAMGGLVPASFARAARAPSVGWVAPLFGTQLLADGAAAVAQAWESAGRNRRPRIITGRYFALGADADAYIHHYYGDEYFAAARADTLTSPKEVDAELARLEAAGCTDVVLYPCSGELEQVSLLAHVLTHEVIA